VQLALTPLHLVESTTDSATAQRWWGDYRHVGLEGPVVKRVNDPYPTGTPGLAAALHTEDFLVLGVTGVASAPSALVLGRHDGQRLRVTAVSKPLSVDLSADLC